MTCGSGSDDSLSMPTAQLASFLSALAVVAPHVTLNAPGHTPKINTHWNYAVHATLGGKPASARITAQIVDPIGGTHPVEFGSSTKKITNRPFKGIFRDYIIWPPSSRGIPLRLRVIVRIGTARKTIDYRVTPHA
jgi:hypothetical protein